MQSESNELKEDLYKYSKNYLFEDSGECINSRLHYWKINNKYEELDNVFYTIDLSRLNSTIALQLIEESRYIADKLVMRNFFIDNCKKVYVYKKGMFKDY